MNFYLHFNVFLSIIYICRVLMILKRYSGRVQFMRRDRNVSKSKLLSVVCAKREFETCFAFLQQNGYTLQAYACLSEAVEHSTFFEAPVTLIDMDSEGAGCFDRINAIHGTHPEIRVVLTGDFRSTVFPEDIPRVFHFVRKPFPPDKLSGILDRAFTIPFGIERRREPRIPIELPVDLYYRADVYRTHTNNISLHGMQAVWPAMENISELAEKHRGGNSPIAACRLFLSGDEESEDEHINIPVTLRYIKDNEPTLMGFEFRGLDLDLRTKLQDVVIW